LDVNTESDFVKQCVLENGSGFSIMSSEIVRSSRTDRYRSVAANVVIDAKDKNKALDAGSWPEGIIIRP
jgi:hypothetical protein